GLIPREPGADVLEVEVVLIRPEPRNLRERPALTGHRPPDRVPVPESRVVVLHAHRGLEERVPEAGTVPRRVDVGCVRPSELVDHDSTIAANAGRFRELDVRLHADRDEDVLTQRRQLAGSSSQVDAATAVDPGQPRAELGAEDAE